MNRLKSNVYPLSAYRTSSATVRTAESFETLVRCWLAEDCSGIKASTRAAYTTLAERHIISALGHLPPRLVTPQIVSDFIRGKSLSLAPSTVRSIASVLCAVLRFAAGDTAARAEDVPKPLPRHKTANVLSESEQRRLENVLLADPDCVRFGILLCLYTGLRLGELCALRWRCLDPREGTVDVVETVQRIRTGTGTRLIFDRPKSSSSLRRIPLPPWLCRLAEQFRRDDDCFLLTGCSHRPMEPRTLQYRFQKYLRQAQIRSVNFHALRHTFATNCVQRGFDAKTLSCILGHSNVNLTLNTYVHPPLAVMRSCMEKLTPACISSCI